MRPALLSLVLLASSCAGQCAAIGGGAVGAGSASNGSIGGRRSSLTPPFSLSASLYVDIENSGAELTDFQVLVSDALLGDDASFFSDQPATTTVPFWKAATGSYWVKVPSLTATDTTRIYARLSGSGASDADGVFILYDDFTGSALDTDKWPTTTLGSGSITVSGGAVRLTAPATAVGTSMSSSAIPATSVIAEARVLFHSATGDRRHRINITSDHDWGFFNIGGTGGFRVFWAGSSSAYATAGTWYEVYQDLAAANTHSATVSAISFSGSISSITAAGHLSFTVGDGAPTSLGDMSADWIRVRKYTANTVTVSVGEL